jgi:uncharacterized protein
MNLRDEIWILSDDRPGTVSQSIGLAQELGFEYKIIKLDYSFFSALPNFFLQNSLLRISAKLRKNFKNLDHLPSIVISAGRRSAPIALYLKKISKNQTKIVQIMRPNLSFNKFDFVILPQHDKVDEAQFSNVITSIGSLTKTDKNLIAREQQKFLPWFDKITKTKIAILVGGSSEKTKFEKKSAEKLAEISSKIANKMDATLLVLNSRRTSIELTNSIKSRLKCDFKFFDWAEVKNENPYLAILGFADFFIITGDSVSMISECCSTGKPVFIFDDGEISSVKHRNFHQNLFAENYAKKLLKNSDFLENFSPKKLQETKRVAALIRAKF